PFNKPDADLVLRSSDNVECRVRSHILIEASPVFESMLASSQCAAEADAVNTCRTIDLAEDSATIEALLRLCYPVVNDAVFWSKMGVKEAELVLRAAFQYKMKLPARLTMEHIHSMDYDRPLAVWAIGCRLRLEKTAARAAQCSLWRSEFLSSINPEDLEGVSAGQYFRLRTYQKRGEPLQNDGLLDPTPMQRLPPPPPCGQPQYPPIHIPSPDLICLACDGTESRVRKEPLCAVSPVIRTLVMTAERLLTRAPTPSPSLSSSDSEDDPGPSDGVSERLPSVQFEYSAAALCTLLRFYNLGTLESFPSDPRAIADVLAATHEYQLQGLHEIARHRWDSAAAQVPLRAYFAAISRGLDDCARTAARLALHLDLKSHYVNDLEDAPAQAYHRLIRYHETCIGIVTAVLTGHSDAYGESFSAVTESATSPVSSSQYWPKLHTESIHHKLRPRPGNVTTFNLGTIFENATTEDAWCSACTPLAKDLISLSDALDTTSSDIAAVSIRLRSRNVALIQVLTGLRWQVTLDLA
ncbi:hypothetical protein FKP32DRAFT_1570311, partial [Trametes sanguinea]